MSKNDKKELSKNDSIKRENSFYSKEENWKIQEEISEIWNIILKGEENKLIDSLNILLKNKEYNNEEKSYILEKIWDILIWKWDYANAFKIYDKSIDLAEMKENIIELYRKKINFLFGYKEENPKIFSEIIRSDANEIIKIWHKWEWNFNLWLLNESNNDLNSAKKYYKNAIDYKYQDAIYKYAEILENDFLKIYNKIANKKNKEDYINDNLEEFEKEYFKLLELTEEIINKNWKILENLYWNLWVFYEKIWLITKAIESYNNAINSSKELYSYLWNLWNLYLKNKNKLNFLDNWEYLKLAIESFSKLENISAINSDTQNLIYALEEKAKIYKKLWNNEKYKENYNYILNILNWEKIINEKYALKYLELTNILNIKLDEEAELYIFKILISSNIKHLNTIWYYYEEKWFFEYAFLYYLYSYKELKWKNEYKNAWLAFFIETTLKNKEINEINEEIEEIENELLLIEKKKKNKKISEYEQNLINEKNEILQEKQFLNNYFIPKILKTIDNEENLGREDIATLFDLSLPKNFYEEINSEIIQLYIVNYENKKEYFDIFLHRILKNIWEKEWISKPISKIIDKIYKKEELSYEDKKDIYIYVENSDEVLMSK